MGEYAKRAAVSRIARLPITAISTAGSGGTLCRLCDARMALVDRATLPNGTAVEALLAIARRCPDCKPVAASDRALAGGGSSAPARTTADLDASLYGFLRAYVQARDVAAADVIRELIRQVRADPDLSARVTDELDRRREALAEAMRAARE